MSDGSPTDNELPAHWQEQGVLTFVIGLPGSEPARILLDDMANAGGTDHHRSPGSPEQLEYDVGFAAAI